MVPRHLREGSGAGFWYFPLSTIYDFGLVLRVCMAGLGLDSRVCMAGLVSRVCPGGGGGTKYGAVDSPGGLLKA